MGVGGGIKKDTNLFLLSYATVNNLCTKTFCIVQCTLYIAYLRMPDDIFKNKQE